MKTIRLMTRMKTAFALLRTGAVAVLLVAVVSGCRTYGGYGTVEKTVETIGEANEQFDRSLARAEGRLESLRSEAANRPELAPASEKFAAVVSEHAEMLRDHRESLDRLTTRRAGYRAASRLLGSIVTDHHAIANRYRDVLADAASLSGRLPAAVRDRSLYQQVPPYFIRLENRIDEVRFGDVVTQGT